MTHDLPPNSLDDDNSDAKRTDIDRLVPSDSSQIETVEDAFRSRAHYIELAARILENAIHTDPEPLRDDFPNDHSFQIAAVEWDARMADLLRESAELHGRMLELEELLAELRLIKRYAAENRDTA